MTNELGMSSISRNSEDTCASLLEQLYYMQNTLRRIFWNIKL